MEALRRKRFTRERTLSTVKPLNRVEPTPRDEEAFLYLHAHRLLTSRQILELLGIPITMNDAGALTAPAKKYTQRLQRLYVEKFVDRVPGSYGRPIVYALDFKGYQHLSNCGHSVEGRPGKNRSLAESFYQHTIHTADVMIAFHKACRSTPRLELVSFAEILAARSREERLLRKKPGHWKATVTGRDSSDIKKQLSLGITPDKIFGLRDTTRPEGANLLLFFLEADRGTMPVYRKDLKQTSIFRKLVTYHATQRQGLHKELFGVGNFRTLTVTTNPDRVETMIAARSRLRGYPGTFLFATLDSLKSENPLGSSWVDGNGEITSLT